MAWIANGEAASSIRNKLNMDTVAAATKAQTALTTAESATQTGSSSKTVTVTSSGTAPSGTNVGDTVVTGGGAHAYYVAGTGDLSSLISGSKYNAKSNLTSVQLYDGGGQLNSGAGAVNLSGQPEQILSPEQTKAWMQLPNLLSGLISMGRSNIVGTSSSSINNSKTSNLSIANMTVQAKDANSFLKQMNNLIAITGNTGV